MHNGYAKHKRYGARMPCDTATKRSHAKGVTPSRKNWSAAQAYGHQHTPHLVQQQLLHLHGSASVSNGVAPASAHAAHAR